jgi:hypothetical protein
MKPNAPDPNTPAARLDAAAAILAEALLDHFLHEKCVRQPGLTPSLSQHTRIARTESLSACLPSGTERT